MSHDYSPAVNAVELPGGGVRYRLPCRSRRRSRVTGINLAGGGLLLFALMSSMVIASYLVGQSGSGAADGSESAGAADISEATELIRLLGSIFCCFLPLLLCYLFMTFYGLALAFGRTEIILTPSSIAASQRVGPFSATHRQLTSLLEGLVVRRGNTMADNELQATLRDRSPLTLAWDMPADQLRQLAAELAERHRTMTAANTPTIAVSEMDLPL
jgi:hypothetical protein